MSRRRNTYRLRPALLLRRLRPPSSARVRCIAHQARYPPPPMTAMMRIVPTISISASLRLVVMALSVRALTRIYRNRDGKSIDHIKNPVAPEELPDYISSFRRPTLQLQEQFQLRQQQQLLLLLLSDAQLRASHDRLLFSSYALRDLQQSHLQQCG